MKATGLFNPPGFPFASNLAKIEMTKATSEPELSLPEMLRVMDVARAIRKERETVEQAFSRDEERELLRTRLMETAKITGDKITEAEVDVAIDHYYDNLHAFKPPAFGWAVALAHAWVWRTRILVLGIFSIGASFLFWWLFLASTGPFSSTGRQDRRLAAAMQSIESHESSIRSVTESPEVLADVKRFHQQAVAANASRDFKRLQEITQQLEGLDRKLNEEYEIRIVGNDGRQSAFEGVMTDDAGSRAAGYFVIVEARGKSGIVLPRQIHDTESGAIQTVSIWAERVPQAVYERLKQDKLVDNLLDETLFGVKNRGELEDQIVIKDENGQPLKRGIQMTDWKN